MLQRLTVQGFKSLTDVDIELPKLAVLFGPNTAGKSNVLDAIQALSRLGTARTLSEALADPIRGHPIEAFTFPGDGLAGLLKGGEAQLNLGAELLIKDDRFRYQLEIGIDPKSGTLAVRNEYLANLDKSGKLKYTPSIEQMEGKLSGIPSFYTAANSPENERCSLINSA